MSIHDTPPRELPVHRNFAGNSFADNHFFAEHEKKLLSSQQNAFKIADYVSEF